MSGMRLIDSARWNYAWFQALPPEYKLLFIFVEDHTDVAAVWPVNKGLAEYHVGSRVDWSLAAELFRSQVIILASGEKWFLLETLTRRYPAGLSEKSNAHQAVKRLLLLHKIDQKAWPGGGTQVAPRSYQPHPTPLHSPVLSEVVGGSAEGGRPEPTALIPKTEQFRKFLMRQRLAHEDDHVQEWLGFAKECGCSNQAMTESCIESIVRQARKDNSKVRFVSHVEHLGPGWKKWNEKRETERIAKETA